MIEVYCPNCGKQHSSTNKFCEYCGKNLEDTILRQKQKHLPIKYEQSIPPQQQGAVIDTKIEKQRKPAVTALRILGPVFLLLAIAMGIIVFNMNLLEIWAFIIIGIFASLFIVFSILGSTLSPGRRRGCGGGPGCYGSDCSGCGDCGRGCGGDCGSDCGGCDCGGCGDCGGCDCGGCDC